MAHQRWEYRVVVVQPGASDEALISTEGWELVPDTTPNGLERRWTETWTESYTVPTGVALLDAVGHRNTRTRTRSARRSARYVTHSMVRVYKRPARGNQ